MATVNLYSKEQIDVKIPDNTSASVGDVLAKGADGNEWITPSSGGSIQKVAYTSWANLIGDIVNRTIKDGDIIFGEMIRVNRTNDIGTVASCDFDDFLLVPVLGEGGSIHLIGKVIYTPNGRTPNLITSPSTSTNIFRGMYYSSSNNNVAVYYDHFETNSSHTAYTDRRYDYINTNTVASVFRNVYVLKTGS